MVDRGNFERIPLGPATEERNLSVPRSSGMTKENCFRTRHLRTVEIYLVGSMELGDFKGLFQAVLGDRGCSKCMQFYCTQDSAGIRIATL